MDNLGIWLFIVAVVTIFAGASWLIMSRPAIAGKKIFSLIPSAILIVMAVGFLIASRLDYGAGSWNDLIFAVFGLIFGIAGILTITVTTILLVLRNKSFKREQ